MKLRDAALFSLLLVSPILVPAHGFAQEQDPLDDIPQVGDKQMNLLDEPDFLPPPPPFSELTQELRDKIKSDALSVLKKFQTTTVGRYLQKELIRREEVCGPKYTWQVDSVSDFMGSPKDWMPARVKVLADPQEAFLAKKLAIEQAQCEIWINTYIFNDAPTTKTLIYELSKAIARGVSVRFTIDSSGSATGTFQLSGPFHSDFKALLFAAPGVNQSPLCKGQVATVDEVLFNPSVRLTNIADAATANLFGVDTKGRTSLDINRRSHDKILFVDGHYPDHSIAIVGGRNWTDSYYGMPQPDSRTYEDMEVLVRDDATRDSRIRLIDTVGAHANRLFCHKGNRWIYRSFSTKNRLVPEYKAGYQELLARPAVKKILARMGAHFNETNLTSADVKWGNEIENIRRDQADADQNPDRLAVRTMNPESIVDISHDLIATAKKSIHIVSPYVYLSNKERDVLKSWAADKPGRKVIIISNSLMTSDNVPAQTLVDKSVAPGFLTEGKLLDGRIWTPEPQNVAFYELGRLDSDRLKENVNNPNKKPYGKLHAKYWTIDGEISFVGSHNFDPRSRYYNSEVGFFIRSKKIAAELESRFTSTQKRSYIWGTDDWKKLIDSPAFERKREAQDFLETVFGEVPGLASLI